jgi:hypothetical protein
VLLPPPPPIGILLSNQLGQFILGGHVMLYLGQDAGQAHLQPLAALVGVDLQPLLQSLR